MVAGLVVSSGWPVVLRARLELLGLVDRVLRVADPAEGLRDEGRVKCDEVHYSSFVPQPEALDYSFFNLFALENSQRGIMQYVLNFMQSECQKDTRPANKRVQPAAY